MSRTERLACYCATAVGLLLSVAVVAGAVFGLIVGPGWSRLAAVPFLPLGGYLVFEGLRLWRDTGRLR